MNNILVSIVIPTYRRPQLLTRCIKALIAQKFDKSRFEIIVVSDGPDEQTKHIFDEWAAYEYPHLRFLPLPQKKGPAAARNYGWQNAKGQIIAFTDDDCIPDSHWLYELIKNCKPRENIAITGKVIVPLGKRPTDYEQNTAHLETADFITANCACTREALIKAGGFDEQFSMAWREDSDLEFKLMQQQAAIKRINTAIVIHPVRESVFGVSIREQKKTMYDALLYKKHPQLFKKKIRQVLSPILYYFIVMSLVILIFGLINNYNALSVISLSSWIAFTGYFIFKRLYTTKLTLRHITEMVITSLVIPFVSVYWQWYGAVKYRVLFI